MPSLDTKEAWNPMILETFPSLPLLCLSISFFFLCLKKCTLAARLEWILLVDLIGSICGYTYSENRWLSPRSNRIPGRSDQSSYFCDWMGASRMRLPPILRRICHCVPAVTSSSACSIIHKRWEKPVIGRRDVISAWLIGPFDSWWLAAISLSPSWRVVF